MLVNGITHFAFYAFGSVHELKLHSLCHSLHAERVSKNIIVIMVHPMLGSFACVSVLTRRVEVLLQLDLVNAVRCRHYL